MLCSRCKKRMAVVFVTRSDGEKTIDEGLCLKCAKELNIPQVKQMMERMGITDEDVDAMSDQLETLDTDNFELGGAGTMPPFLQNLMSSIMPAGNQEEQKKATDNKITKKEQKTKKRKYLDTYCTNLTEKAKNNQLDAIIGRDKEIFRTLQILSRRTKNNPCLIGEPGVGKTAIAEGIAIKIANNDVPFKLMNKELYLLDLTSLVAGTQFRGQFESRVKGLIDEVKTAGNVILFIDEVHTLVGTGDSEGSMSAANILKPALSRGEIQVIGATTFTEYRKYIEKDSALERRFQPVTINEPTIQETTDVLVGIKKYYELYHQVKISDEIVKMVVNLSEKFITDRYLPDKAIDLLDEACSLCAIENKTLAEYDSLNKELKLLNENIEKLEQETENINFEEIAKIKADTMRVKSKLQELEPIVADIKVAPYHVAKVIELWTGIPASKITQSEFTKLKTLEDVLKSKIIGQDEAVEAVTSAIKRTRVQLNKRKRPASFIFVGPTGVGKTELVKVLAKELFDTVDPLIRLDMSEYMEKHAVSRLIGSPPGYVGYDEAGQLTEKVRRKPYSVVLFDEIEKAHPDVMNILLQILDEGRVTDSQGRVVNFEHTIIAMTSNAGSSDKTGIAGFNKTGDEIEKAKATKALSEFLRPEFLSRIDEIIVFKPLSFESLTKIAALMLDEMKEPLAEQGIKMNYDQKACEFLAKKSQGGKYAARDLRKTIRKEVEDKVAECIIDAGNNTPSCISVTAENDQIKILDI